MCCAGCCIACCAAGCAACVQVYLWRVCESVLRLTRPMVKDNVRLINCISRDMPPVKGDSTRLMQVRLQQPGSAQVERTCRCCCVQLQRLVECAGRARVCMLFCALQHAWMTLAYTSLPAICTRCSACLQGFKGSAHSHFRSAAAALLGCETALLAVTARSCFVLRGALLLQVLLNLVCTCLKFTHAGDVRVSASQTHSAASVVVADTGQGIPPEQLAQALDPFQQVRLPQTPQVIWGTTASAD